MKETMRTLPQAANEIRREILRLSHLGRTPHIGSCLSVVEILTGAYWGGLNISPENADSPTRDRLIFGKGHAAAALLAVLATRGFFPPAELDDFNRDGGRWQEHPGPQWPRGVENASGSLGHAVPLALGLAMAAKITGSNFRACAVIGDGECNEGSIWEAAMLAGGKQIGNLCVIVDANRWQATGRSHEITALEPLREKWDAFGWDAIEIDGHDTQTVHDTLAAFGNREKPLAIIARTIKGKGVSFMEDDNNWHYRLLSDEELKRACTELAQYD